MRFLGRLFPITAYIAFKQRVTLPRYTYIFSLLPISISQTFPSYISNKHILVIPFSFPLIYLLYNRYTLYMHISAYLLAQTLLPAVVSNRIMLLFSFWKGIYHYYYTARQTQPSCMRRQPTSIYDQTIYIQIVSYCLQNTFPLGIFDILYILPLYYQDRLYKGYLSPTITTTL